MLGLRCCMQGFSSCGKQGLLFVAVYGLLTAVASVVVEHKLSCSMACGIFPDQGLNPRPLHWQTDSYALYHQGSPRVVLSYLFQCGFIAYPRGILEYYHYFAAQIISSNSGSSFRLTSSLLSPTNVGQVMKCQSQA